MDRPCKDLKTIHTEYTYTENEINYGTYEPLNILNLDDHILFTIFQYLPIKERVRAERVCKRFQNIISMVWYDMNILNGEAHQWGYNFKKETAAVKASIMSKIMPLCGRYLVYLDLCHINLPEKMLLNLGFVCPRMQVLRLGPNNLLSYEIIKSLAAHCKNLTSISFRCHPTECTDENLSHLLGHCQKLKQITVIDSCEITGEFLLYLPSTLRSLKLKNCMSLTCGNLSKSLRRLVNLETLIFNDCIGFLNENQNDIANDNLITFISPDIEHLAIPFYRHVELNSIHTLYNLSHLNIAGANINDGYLIILCQSCPHLDYLNINYCSNITNHGIKALSMLFCLEILHLSHLPNITDDELYLLPLGLRELYCTHNNKIKNNGILKFIARNIFIEKVDVSYCLSINNNDQLIRKIAMIFQQHLRVFSQILLVKSFKLCMNGLPILFSKKHFNNLELITDSLVIERRNSASL